MERPESAARSPDGVPAEGCGLRRRAGRRIKPTSLRALPPALLRVGRMPTKKLRVDQRHARTTSASRDSIPVSCRLGAARSKPSGDRGAVRSRPAHRASWAARGAAGAVLSPATGSARTPTVPCSTYRERTGIRHDMIDPFCQQIARLQSPIASVGGSQSLRTGSGGQPGPHSRRRKALRLKRRRSQAPSCSHP